MNQPALDSLMMDRAIALAQRGEGRVEPNPMVGCVIVKRGRIIGQGYHRRFGGPHAEIDALGRCTQSPRGATVYVSLEPCCHTGKTPPCADALIEAGVAEVVVAAEDPNPLVAGGGMRALRRAGITVRIGIHRESARRLIAPFLTRIRQKRPYVIAKWAQSLDGKLATRTGDSKWISSEPSRKQVHRLRARVDAVLVGSGTVLADDPLLTARGVRIKRVATRVVLDGRLRIPIRSQLAATAHHFPTLVFTTAARARSPKAKRLRELGVEVCSAATRQGRLSLSAGLRLLHKRDMTNLLVEGGGALLTSYLNQRLVDEAWVYVAPMMVGDARAVSVLPQRRTKSIADALRADRVTSSRAGDDVRFQLQLTRIP